jgi:hypothetical protein
MIDTDLCENVKYTKTPGKIVRRFLYDNEV